MTRRFLSVTLLILAAFGLFFGVYGMLNSLVFLERARPLSAAANLVVVSTGIALVVGGAKLWNGWPRVLSLLMVLIGIGALQTRPTGPNVAAASLRSSRVFQLSGAMIAVAGAIIYFSTRRHRR